MLRLAGLLRFSRSVRARLALLFSAVIGAISIFLFLFFPLTVKRDLEGTRDLRAREVAKMAAVFVAPAVVFRHREDIHDQLSAAALANEEVVYFYVVDEEGWVLEHVPIYERGIQLTGDEDPCGGREGPLPEKKIYCVRESIEFQNRTVGTLWAALDIGDLESEVGAMRRRVGAVSGFILVLGLLASYLSMTIFVRPLQKMVVAVDRIADGDLSVRVPVYREDEVGILARAFNSMVENLQRTQTELRQAYSNLEQILDNLPALVAVFDIYERILYINPAGVPDPERRKHLIGKPLSRFWEYAGIGRAAQDRLREDLHRCVTQGEVTRLEIAWGPGSQAEARTFLALFGPIRGASGCVERVVGYAVEISELRRAEQTLREREDQLRQAQKMEAVGRLAGGVAHDFNNLLTAIRGNTDLLLLEAEEQGGISEELEQIRLSAERGARLTRQLLAFSRAQILSPELLDLNGVVDAIEKMIRRLIGEHIQVRTSLNPQPLWITADRGQIEQVILNLAVNAGDAMPQGGTLTLATSLLLGVGEGSASFSGLHEETFAALHVMDTGIGMDGETKGRIFEPFFTTKPMGKGTGLGLATVYGIVEQSGGHIGVESAPAKGTTFSVYLPSTPPKGEGEGGDSNEGAGEEGREETILVVEDHELVRDLTSTLLRRQGFRVLAAGGPAEALKLSENHPGPIHLLLTDLVMPGMSGRALADRVSLLRPDVRVLFMSGYTDDEVLRHGISQGEVHFLPKPFSYSALSKAIRDALPPEREEVRES